MYPRQAYQRFCKEVTLAAGDASKEIMPAAAGYQYVITRFYGVILTAAAQVVYAGDTSGTNKVMSIPASFAVGNQVIRELEEGLKLVAGEAYLVKPAAAGPSLHVVTEGYILKAASALV